MANAGDRILGQLENARPAFRSVVASLSVTPTEEGDKKTPLLHTAVHSTPRQAHVHSATLQGGRGDLLPSVGMLFELAKFVPKPSSKRLYERLPLRPPVLPYLAVNSPALFPSTSVENTAQSMRRSGRKEQTHRMPGTITRATETRLVNCQGQIYAEHHSLSGIPPCLDREVYAKQGSRGSGAQQEAHRYLNHGSLPLYVASDQGQHLPLYPSNPEPSPVFCNRASSVAASGVIQRGFARPAFDKHGNSPTTIRHHLDAETGSRRMSTTGVGRYGPQHARNTAAVPDVPAQRPSLKSVPKSNLRNTNKGNASVQPSPLVNAPRTQLRGPVSPAAAPCRFPQEQPRPPL